MTGQVRRVTGQALMTDGCADDQPSADGVATATGSAGCIRLPYQRPGRGIGGDRRDGPGAGRRAVELGLRPDLGWDVAAIIFCTWIWLVIWPMDAAETAAKARSVDPNRTISDVLMLSACVASIGAVGIVVVGAHAASGATAEMLAALGLVSVAVSWLTVHTIFTLGTRCCTTKALRAA